MSAFDYARAVATAARLIGKFGQTGAVRRQTTTGPAYDPIITTTDVAATFAVLDYSDIEIDGSRIQATDKRVFLSAEGLAIAPTTTDKLLVNTVAHSIIAVRPLAPAGTVVFYELQIRR